MKMHPVLLTMRRALEGYSPTVALGQVLEAAADILYERRHRHEKVSPAEGDLNHDTYRLLSGQTQEDSMSIGFYAL
jgi:hypothetical protein